MDKTPSELINEIKTELSKDNEKIKAVAEEAIAKTAKNETLSADLKEKADTLMTSFNEQKTRLDTLEQKMLRDPGTGGDDVKSLGEQFTESEAFKGWAPGANKGSASHTVKTTLTSLTTNANGSVGDAIANTRLPGILPLARRRLTIRELISQGQMDGNTLEYVKVTGFTNSAAPVAEGASKPESDLKFDIVTTSARVLAHWMKATTQVLSDIPLLRSMIDDHLLYGLQFVEEAQLLNGDGTGQNLLGIVPQATAYAAPISIADPNKFDTLRLAMLQAFLAEYPATGHVLHPSDWAEMEMLKDTNGRYIIGNPQGNTTQTMWGLPVVDTQAMALGKFLTGAFKLGAQLFDRWQARVETGFVNDDFIKNLVTVRAEERLALAVYRPEAFIYGTF